MKLKDVIKAKVAAKIKKATKKVAAKCKDAGYTTVSMAKDWTTIYGDGVRKVEPKAEELPAAA